MILHAIGKLTLEIDDNDLAMGAIIHDDIGGLVRLQAFPTWCNPAPLVTAELVLRAMRPHAPTYHPNVIQHGTERAGFYHAPDDAVAVVNRDGRSPGEVAEIVLHELGHAAGHPQRTGRWTVGTASPDAPIVFTGHDGEESRFEEAAASMTSHIAATRLGIACRWNLAPKHFLEHMSYLPVARLAGVIEQAQRGARFLLNITNENSTTTKI